MPANVFAEEPPGTLSAASEKLPPNSELTDAPSGLGVSSLTAASVALPLATGASLADVTISDSATVPDEICVGPPVNPVRLTTAPLLIAGPPLSIRLALSAVAAPL